MDLVKDLKLAEKIIKDNKRDYYYEFYNIYPQSTEALSFIFSGLDIKNKKILSVLASSDQVFSAYYYKALEVDSFDINPLCEYYYYLRKWCIEKRKDIDIYKKSNDYLKAVVQEVNFQNEKEKKALQFWQELLKNDNLMKSTLFLATFGIASVPFRNNIEKLKERIPQEELNFKNLDIFLPIDIDKKYDLVYLSNILEYATDIKKLEVAEENMERLVNRGGQIVCSYTRRHKDIFGSCEQLIFDKDFTFENEQMGEGVFSHYIYTKK